MMKVKQMALIGPKNSAKQMNQRPWKQASAATHLKTSEVMSWQKNLNQKEAESSFTHNSFLCWNLF